VKSTIVLGVPISPSKNCELGDLGDRKLIVVNHNGRIEGGKETLIGNIESINGDLVNVHLTESNRKLQIRNNWISYTEDVTLYVRTNHHMNDSFNTPAVDYFAVKGDTEVRLDKGSKELFNIKDRYNMAVSIKVCEC